MLTIINQVSLIFAGTMLAYTLIYGLAVEWIIPATMVFQLALLSLLCAILPFLFSPGADPAYGLPRLVPDGGAGC